MICKAGLLLTVMALVFLRRTHDFDGPRKPTEEATLNIYDNQWRSSWQDQDVGDGGGGGGGGKILGEAERKFRCIILEGVHVCD